MTIKLVGSSSGSVSLQAPASTSGGANRVLTLPDVNGTVATTATAGKILQVVNVFKGDRFTSSSESFVDITGLTITITPTQANSKILLQGSVNGGTQDDNLDYAAGIRTMRSIAGGSFSDDNKLNGAADGNRPRITFRCFASAYNTDHMPSGFHFSGVDDPSYSVGNAIIYKMQVRCQLSSRPFVLNGTSANGNTTNIYSGRYMSSLIAMEIAA
tara:strand:- start:21 stop:662 length:642 start_codon:yes stop_codon:yes gene_type:complete